MVYHFQWSVMISLSNGGLLRWKVSRVTNQLFLISKSSGDNFDYSSSLWSNRHVYILPYREEALIIDLIHIISRSWVQIFIETNVALQLFYLSKNIMTFAPPVCTLIFFWFPWNIVFILWDYYFLPNPSLSGFSAKSKAVIWFVIERKSSYVWISVSCLSMLVE